MKHEHHAHEQTPVSREETLALLRYMAQHNAHHAEELRETAKALPEKCVAPLEEAAALMEQASGIINLTIAGWEE